MAYFRPCVTLEIPCPHQKWVGHKIYSELSAKIEKQANSDGHNERLSSALHMICAHLNSTREAGMQYTSLHNYYW